MTYNFYDFFAGGGMVSYGLGQRWNCVFANDIDQKKAQSYRMNLDGGDELVVRDVAKIASNDLPGVADLAWASFPCQDLSLAGAGAGLKGKRSGTFWPFWRLIRKVDHENRAPRLIVLENVFGAVTSHGGRDFSAIASAFSGRGYRFGAVVVDAVRFVPQSRPRLFVVGVRSDLTIPSDVVSSTSRPEWHPPGLIAAHNLLSNRAASRWVWWDIPIPPTRNTRFSDLIDERPVGVDWHNPEVTRHIIGLMSERNLVKLDAAKKIGRRMVGAVYRRTRPDANGKKVQRAEIRFDEISGCLRTPAGGSSRQTILVVEGDKVRSRLLSPKEAARLMGLPDEYMLPERYNEAYHLAGDGVAVPVVRHLSENILEPILIANEQIARKAA